jgi:hypothetical protein
MSTVLLLALPTGSFTGTVTEDKPHPRDWASLVARVEPKMGRKLHLLSFANNSSSQKIVHRNGRLQNGIGLALRPRQNAAFSGAAHSSIFTTFETVVPSELIGDHRLYAGAEFLWKNKVN